MSRGNSLLNGILIGALAVPMPGTAQAGTLTLLHTFKDTPDGASQWSQPILNGGKFYGTTLQGGADNDGIVYSMDSKGHITILYSFLGGNDGRRPLSNLIADKTGNLYGVTEEGGSYDEGTVYRLAPDGTETQLHIFTGGSDGANSDAGVVFDSSGNLFGTAPIGGENDNGVVFEISAGGSFSVLHSFTGGSDGAGPEGTLLLGMHGNLYGTAIAGGAHGWGDVFRIAPDGTFQVLYSFADGSDGRTPQSQLIEDKTGNLYGTTDFGGGIGCNTGNGCGTIFKLAPDGTETVLCRFTGGSDGAAAYTGVVADKQGNLYAALKSGGTANGYGALDELAPDGTLTVLHDFQGSRDGRYPDRGVIDPRTSKLYGATYAGGGDAWGTIYEIGK